MFNIGGFDMEIKTDEKLESTGYRCLFEYVRKEGIEPLMSLIDDVRKVPSKNILIQQAVINGKNDLLALVKKNQDVIHYLREHEKELELLSLTNKKLYQTLHELSSNISLLDLYLENAKRLEELKVSEIEFVTFSEFDRYHIEIMRTERGDIKFIKKYYTDGKIKPNGQEQVMIQCFRASEIPFLIALEDGISFILSTDNRENGYQYRNIQIRDFGFDGTKLPTEAEIQSYEIPKQYILK